MMGWDEMIHSFNYYMLPFSGNEYGHVAEKGSAEGQQRLELRFHGSFLPGGGHPQGPQDRWG